MATFTLSHALSDNLKTTQQGMRRAWRRVLQGRAWMATRERFGFSYIVAAEVTHGVNGWHPHLHVLFLPTRGLNHWNVAEVQELLAARWTAAIIRELGEAYKPLQPWGLTFKQTSKAEYISKLGLEMSDPGTKKAHKDQKVPLELLEMYADSLEQELDQDGLDHPPNTDVLKLYQEYEAAMKGRKDLTWSTDLKIFRVEAVEQLKAEHARERELAKLIAEIPYDVWDDLRDIRNARIGVLEAAEEGGLDAVCVLVKRELGAFAALRVRERTNEHLKRLELETPEPEKPPPKPPQLSLPGIVNLSHFI